MKRHKLAKMKITFPTRYMRMRFVGLLVAILSLVSGCEDSIPKRACNASLSRQFISRLAPDAILSNKGYRLAYDYSIGKTARGDYEWVLRQADHAARLQLSYDSLSLEPLISQGKTPLVDNVCDHEAVSVAVLEYVPNDHGKQARSATTVTEESADRVLVTSEDDPQDDEGTNTDDDDAPDMPDGEDGTPVPSDGEHIAEKGRLNTACIFVACRVTEYPLRVTLPEVPAAPTNTSESISQKPSIVQDAEVGDMVMVRDASGKVSMPHASRVETIPSNVSTPLAMKENDVPSKDVVSEKVSAPETMTAREPATEPVSVANPSVDHDADASGSAEKSFSADMDSKKLADVVPANSAAPAAMEHQFPAMCEASVTCLSVEGDGLAPRFTVALQGVDIQVYATAENVPTAKEVADDMAHRLVRMVLREREIRSELAERHRNRPVKVEKEQSLLERIGGDRGLYFKRKF